MYSFGVFSPILASRRSCSFYHAKFRSLVVSQARVGQEGWGYLTPVAAHLIIFLCFFLSLFLSFPSTLLLFFFSFDFLAFRDFLHFLVIWAMHLKSHFLSFMWDLVSSRRTLQNFQPTVLPEWESIHFSPAYMCWNLTSTHGPFWYSTVFLTLTLFIPFVSFSRRLWRKRR